MLTDEKMFFRFSLNCQHISTDYNVPVLKDLPLFLMSHQIRVVTLERFTHAASKTLTAAC